MGKQFKVIAVGTTSVEAERLQKALQKTGLLDSFSCIPRESLSALPADCDVLLARCPDGAEDQLLDILAPLLREGRPPVIFLVDSFLPLPVNRLLNAGAKRVLPFAGLGALLQPSLTAVASEEEFSRERETALREQLRRERELAELRSSSFLMTSHQFRTPLSSILLSADLLRKYDQRLDSQKRIEHLERIEAAAKRLTAMLEDLLVLGRVESGQYQPSPREFDLIAFLERFIQEFAVNDRHQHALVFNHAVEALPVRLDPDVLQRVVDNLLSNALKYSPPGSQVLVSVRVEQENTVLEVTDQGIGIPERDLELLFQPFRRASNAAPYPGTGMGLAIIQKSVALLGGHLSLTSQEGSGTTVQVRFPTGLSRAQT